MITAPRGTVSRRRLGGIDLVLVGVSILLSLIGAVMVYTATRGTLLATGISPTYFLKRQLVWVALGLVAMVVMSINDYRRLEPIGMFVYGAFVFLLVAVLVPGIGKHALGSQRWFSLGPLQLQPSEFAVLALIVGLATFCSRRREGLTWSDVIKALVMGGIPIALVIAQPDLGTGIIMAIVLLVMLAVAGLPTRILVVLIVAAVVVVVGALELGLLHHYQITRITSFLHQDTANPSKALQTSLYNLTQAKNALGSGGLFGTGLLHGAQTNLGYVPEQQTDFIFTAVGEQLGFVGSSVVLLLLGVVAWRMLRGAQLARDSFGRLVCAGIFTFFAFSAFENAGMSMGIMPITGIPLPFISYGGSAVLCFFIGVGLVVSVRRNRMPA
ncbi:MAG: rod shape-determining protein RodA [Actinomycetota bacterium]|nr:rod shape-determining protein RodA [Actinomycetota bacterium]